MFNDVLGSCLQTEKESKKYTSDQKFETTTEPLKIIQSDFKKDQQYISIGENYHVTAHFIAWQWAALADDDNKIDSTGIDCFMYLGEPSIEYNNSSYRPALFIETESNIISSFTYSILFDLEDLPDSEENFLLMISESIQKLKTDSVRSQLIATGKFEVQADHYYEIYELKITEDSGFDRFVYRITSGKKDI